MTTTSQTLQTLAHIITVLLLSFIGITPVLGSSTYTASYTGRGYYVDSSIGDDVNNGSSSRPWRTLARASQATLNAGDALLLNCGSVWHESVEFKPSFAPSGAVLIGGYGNCSDTQRPTIYGSQEISPSAWQISQVTSTGTIFETQIPGEISDLLLNFKTLARARHPNYLGSNTNVSIAKTGTTGNRITISDDDRIKVGNQSLVGATLVLRSAPWLIEATSIISYDRATGIASMSETTAQPLNTGAGYHLEGLQWMLDTDGEWFHDSSSQRLYLFLSQNNIPSTPVDIIRPRSTLTFRGIPKIRIQQLAVLNSGINGLQILNCSDSTVTDVNIKRSKVNGIIIDSEPGYALPQGISVEHSLVEEAGSTGISSRLVKTKIHNNKIAFIGTHPSIVTPIAAIKVSERQSIVSWNTITQTGFNGISARNRAELIIKNNDITYACTRLTDCAGIYIWDNSPDQSRQFVTENRIARSSVPNLTGAVGGSPDLIAGIYLDEGTNNVDAVNNNISDVRVGINIHKSSNNLVSRNKINVALRSGIRVESSGTDPRSTKGNRIEHNILYVPEYYITDGAGLPITIGGIGQEWVHQTDPLELLSGISKNYVGSNKVIHLGDESVLRWRTRVGSLTRDYGSSAWTALVPSDQTASPFRAKMVNVQGVQLIRDSGLNLSSQWTTYSYTRGASVAVIAHKPACGGLCAAFTPSTNLDVLMQTDLRLSYPASSMMFIRYRAIAQSVNTTSKIEVRSNTPPHTAAGYLEDKMVLPAHAERRREAFFNRTYNGDLRLSIKGTVGTTVLFDDIELFEVSSYKLLSPFTVSRLLVNSSASPLGFTCESLGLTTCNVVDEHGASIGWPITINPSESRIIFLKSAEWSYF